MGLTTQVNDNYHPVLEVVFTKKRLSHRLYHKKTKQNKKTFIMESPWGQEFKKRKTEAGLGTSKSQPQCWPNDSLG